MQNSFKKALPFPNTNPVVQFSMAYFSACHAGV